MKVVRLFCVTVFFAAIASMRGQVALDSFDPNANSNVLVVAVQPADGKIIVGGTFTSVAPNGGAAVPRNRIARFYPDGSLDMAFDPNANNFVHAIAVQADGKILVGGTFNSIGGQTGSSLARLDPTTGVADSSFNPAANGSVLSIAVDSNGKILAGGTFNSIGGQSRNHIARLDSTSGLADAFNPNASGGPGPQVDSIVVQSDGKILVGGFFTTIGGQMRSNIARLDAGGAADSFNSNTNGEVLAIAVQSDSKVLVGGAFTTIGGQTRNNIARLDPTTGTADSFDPNAASYIQSIAVQTDGKVLVGGNFGTIDGQARNRIARLDAATGAVDSFNPNASNRVRSIVLQADGKIVVGGDFLAISGQIRNHVARLAPFQIGSVSSRKTHGSAGDFDISLPLVGEPGVECRSSGGAHTLVITFSNTVVSGNAAVTSGNGSVTGSPVFSGNTMTLT